MSTPDFCPKSPRGVHVCAAGSEICVHCGQRVGPDVRQARPALTGPEGDDLVAAAIQEREQFTWPPDAILAGIRKGRELERADAKAADELAARRLRVVSVVCPHCGKPFDAAVRP